MASKGNRFHFLTIPDLNDAKNTKASFSRDTSMTAGVKVALHLFSLIVLSPRTPTHCPNQGTNVSPLTYAYYVELSESIHIAGFCHKTSDKEILYNCINIEYI